jgi:hypothetical protein
MTGGATALFLAALALLSVEPRSAAQTAVKTAAHRIRHSRIAHHAHAVQQRQIACTVLGCQPIPAACTPVEGRTPGGIPTGFDVITCPPGVWPLK